MLRVCASLYVLLGSLSALGQDRDLEQARALQQTIQKAIARAEPGIACILVSRSEDYQRLGGGAGNDVSGKLGGFDIKRLLAKDKSTEEKARLRQLLDLADPGHVPESYGSGVVIDTAGLVLTNYHVVR